MEACNEASNICRTLSGGGGHQLGGSRGRDLTTLVHFSASREHCQRDTIGGVNDKVAQFQPRSRPMEAVAYTAALLGLT